MATEKRKPNVPKPSSGGSASFGSTSAGLNKIGKKLVNPSNSKYGRSSAGNRSSAK